MKTKLGEMNPFVEIEFLGDAFTPISQVFAEAKEKQKTVSVVIHGFDTWASATKLNA